jgi:hypothetical protein
VRNPFLAAVGLIAGATLLASLSCGGGSPGGTTPNPIPTVGPTSAPTAAPTSAPVGSASCLRIGQGSARPTCNRTHPSADLLDHLDVAIEQVEQQQPSLFNMNDQTVPGSPRVLDQGAYFAGVLKNLDAAGVCAEADPAQTMVHVKDTNDLSEDFRLMDSKGFVWRGPGSYSGSCIPASFPLDPADEIVTILVIAYGFNCNPAVPSPDRGAKVYPVGCDVYITATPKAADGRNVDSKVHGPDIAWQVTEGQDVITTRQWPDVPFNETLYAQTTGMFRICATVQGVTGCLRGEFIPNPPPPSPSPSPSAAARR